MPICEWVRKGQLSMPTNADMNPVRRWTVSVSHCVCLCVRHRVNASLSVPVCVPSSQNVLVYALYASLPMQNSTVHMHYDHSKQSYLMHILSICPKIVLIDFAALKSALSLGVFSIRPVKFSHNGITLCPAMGASRRLICYKKQKYFHNNNWKFVWPIDEIDTIAHSVRIPAHRNTQSDCFINIRRFGQSSWRKEL